MTENDTKKIHFDSIFESFLEHVTLFDKFINLLNRVAEKQSIQ